MKIIRYSHMSQTGYGLLQDGVVKPLTGLPFEKLSFEDRSINLGDVKLLSPCQPSKIIAMGLNYYSHAREMEQAVPNSPLTFLKPPTAVIGPDDSIVYPSASARVDYEGELAVVIKKTAWRVPAHKVDDYIFGYTCFNDVTARDLQRRDNQWTRAKGFDTFAAIGLWIETELNPENLEIETYLNEQLVQKGNTRDMIYSISEIINFISNVMTLLPGDVIATGTPEGIGPMQPGDNVKIKITRIGTLNNYVVANGC